MDTRSGEMVSAQIAKMGQITGLDSANYVSEVPFCIKNDGDSAIVLEIQLWKGEGFIETRIETGWNPEICRAIKQTSQTTNLKWGY